MCKLLALCSCSYLALFIQLHLLYLACCMSHMLMNV